MAGFAAKTTAAADDVGLLFAVQLGGGECSRAGSQKGGCRPAYLSLPHLSPLPVTVPTHSLNLSYPFSPKINLFFCYFYFSFYSYSPTINRPLTLFNVTVRLFHVTFNWDQT